MSTFDCGAESLNDWLRTRALKNETTGASRTFVSIDSVTDAVAGYYCLSASSLLLEDAPGSVRRNMPDPIPVILIGRLAVDQAHKGKGLGASLLQHALLKGLEASRIVGARAFIVDALNEDAERFYSRFGFVLDAAFEQASDVPAGEGCRGYAPGACALTPSNNATVGTTSSRGRKRRRS